MYVNIPESEKNYNLKYFYYPKSIVLKDAYPDKTTLEVLT